MARIKWRRCRGWCLSAFDELWNTCDFHHKFCFCQIFVAVGGPGKSPKILQPALYLQYGRKRTKFGTKFFVFYTKKKKSFLLFYI